MALASAGAIRLVGITTSSSVAPFNPYVTPDDYERFIRQRVQGIKAARSSGLKNIPDPVRGAKGHLKQPGSGDIWQTEPMESEGSRLIIEEAKAASPEKPLVLIMGAGLTIAANAYLLDPAIAERLVVAWLGGRQCDMGDYNGWSDPWAAYIVLSRLRMVQFPTWQADPEVPKEKLLELPDTELRKWMIEKRHPNGSPGPRDADAPPAIALIRNDYVRRTKKVSFEGWLDLVNFEGGTRQVPRFKDDPAAKTIVVTKASRRVATQQWWSAMKNPAAWCAVDSRSMNQ